MILFTTHNILTEDVSPVGYSALCLLRNYLDLDMWESLEVHMTITLQLGRQAVGHFSDMLIVWNMLHLLILNLMTTQEYNAAQTKYGEVTKDWNFPKIHAHSHVFDHIETKGALWCYTTKLFEWFHCSLKCWYQLHTNFKNVEEQVKIVLLVFKYRV